MTRPSAGWLRVAIILAAVALAPGVHVASDIGYRGGVEGCPYIGGPVGDYLHSVGLVEVGVAALTVAWGLVMVLGFVGLRGWAQLQSLLQGARGEVGQ